MQRGRSSSNDIFGNNNQLGLHELNPRLHNVSRTMHTETGAKQAEKNNNYTLANIFVWRKFYLVVQ